MVNRANAEREISFGNKDLMFDVFSISEIILIFPFIKTHLSVISFSSFVCSISMKFVLSLKNINSLCKAILLSSVV